MSSTAASVVETAGRSRSARRHGHGATLLGVKVSRQDLIGAAVAAAYVAAVVITAIAAGGPGTINVPLALLLLLGIAAYVGWSLWRFFTGRSQRAGHHEAHFVAFMALTASFIVAMLTGPPGEGLPGWLLVPFGAAFATAGWVLWAEWRKRR